MPVGKILLFFSDMAATVDDQIEFKEEPTISPLLSRFMVISWVTLVEWELETQMKNFEVTEFRLKKKTCDLWQIPKKRDGFDKIR